MSKLPGKIKTQIVITQIGIYKKPYWWNVPAMIQWKAMCKEVYKLYTVRLVKRTKVGTRKGSKP